MANWEVLHRTPASETEQSATDVMKVSGGHLYRTRVWGHGTHGKGLPPSVAMVFVPDEMESLFRHAGDAHPGMLDAGRPT